MIFKIGLNSTSWCMEGIPFIMEWMIRKPAIHRAQFAFHLAYPRRQRVDESPKQRRRLSRPLRGLAFIPPQFARFIS